jgi:hypothetical protein
MRKKHLLVAALLCSSLLFSACQQAKSLLIPQPISVTVESPTPAATSSATPTSTALNPDKKLAKYEFIATKDGQNALELIQSQLSVETKDYGEAGKFVTSINGLAGSSEYYWAFYVNGKYAETGASKTTLKKGDTIKFTYEAVQLNK